MSNPLFSTIRVKKPRRNAFDMSHEKKLSCNMGKLVPILCQEVVPGDTFKMSSEILVRMAPMIAPVMHRVNVYTHFFFVPNRLVWDDWRTFITGGPKGDGRRPGASSSDAPVSFPIMEFNNPLDSSLFAPGSLADYMGLPYLKPSQNNPVQVSSLPFRAYVEIYNEYYRDQNLTDPVPYSKGAVMSGDVPNLMSLRSRCWEKDYFTSALPFVQRGEPVEIIKGASSGLAPVKMRSGWNTSSIPDNDVPRFVEHESRLNDNSSPAGNYFQVYANKGDMSTSSTPHVGDVVKLTTVGATSFSNTKIQGYNPGSSLVADLSAAGQVTSTTINDLRWAARLQEWLEKMARGGSRYIEQIYNMFGVKSSDARLQRPEYLGGGKTPIMISEVLQTSQSENKMTSDPTYSGTPQGNMSGHGISAGVTHGFKRFFEEHGYIIGIMSIMPRTAYQQGIPRTFFKFDKFDYYWPPFGHLGEQVVYNKEVYAEGDQLPDESVPFGYQSRYSEYKFNHSTVHGDMRSSLKFWHMGRIFNILGDPAAESGTPPLLNESFVTAKPTHRIFAVTDENDDKCWVQLYHNMIGIRPMPKYGTPML